MHRSIAYACLVLGTSFAFTGNSLSFGQGPEIFRCPQADGTVAFRGMPCEEPAAADGSDRDSHSDAAAGSDTEAGNDPMDFVNPFDTPDSAVLRSSSDESSPPSQERAACEQETRDAIDAIDVEMRKGFTEAEGEAYLAELLELTEALRNCKTL